MFEIKFDKQAERFLRKCEKIIFDRISKRLNSLKGNPMPSDSKKVIEYKDPTFRIRIGKHRALYRINYETNRIIVVKIDKREKVY